MNLTRWLIAVAISLGIVCTAAVGEIIYVDADAIGLNDGTSWVDAYNYLQDALADADSAEKPVEVRVAEGIYRPDRTSAQPNGTGDRGASFQMISGVAVKGGYDGFADSDPNGRDISVYESVLSGDLAGNDVDVNDPCDLLTEASRAENSYHVVTARGIDETALLDGFTITGGNFDAFGDFGRIGGGGMVNYASSPTVVNCTFTKNAVAQIGGGMLNRSNSNPRLINCSFTRNYAGYGAGMWNWESRPSVKNCTFTANVSLFSGGGIYNEHDSSPRLTNCAFRGNSAGSSGGGMVNNTGSPALTQTTSGLMPIASSRPQNALSWRAGGTETIGIRLSLVMSSLSL